MELTSLQLQIQEGSDKSVSFGCIIELDFISKGEKGYYVISEEGEYRVGVVQLGSYKGHETMSIDTLGSILEPPRNILGHPVSLSRVLSALGEGYTYYVTLGKIYDGDFGYTRRKLLKEDGSDAYLQDQSDETIQALHGLLVR